MGEPLTGQRKDPDASGGRRSLTAMPTHLIELSPAFVEALKQVAPKARRRKLPIVLAVVAVVVLVVGLVPSTRQRVLSLVLHHTASIASANAAPSPSDAPPIATSTTSAPSAEWVVMSVPIQEIGAPSATAGAAASSPSATPSAASAKATKKAPWWKTPRRAPR